MKTNRILTVVLTSLLFSTFAVAEIRNTPYQELPGITGERIQTVNYKGSMIPFVKLPEVIIEAQALESTLLPATIINGEVTAIANLPEVKIIDIEMDNNRVPIVSNNGQYIAAVYLPMVEIAADLPVEKLVAVKMIGGEPVVTATLEAVEICETRFPLQTVDTHVLASWDPRVQSNPELMIGKKDDDQFFLMQYQGTVTDSNGEQVLVYQFINTIQKSIIGQFRAMVRNFNNL